ncbi:membrane protein insertase YidC [Actinoplanes sp. GCM10030250]|uniref:membrane protein insertase YidC n=1 Tax=Actinoplanes sp. GCM10030250 TaxID=3273376 RepID=UPI003620E713
MDLVYTAISAILLFWHAAWYSVLGAADALGTSWAWVLGIVLLVLTVRMALFPLVTRQIRSQRAIQRVQPQMKALREQHRGDPQTMQAELVKLYRTEKISPFASFLPLIVQAPILFGLLHVLRHLRPSITSETSRTLYGWTLTQFDSAVHAKLFGAPIVAGFTSSGGLAVKIVAGVLILAMTATTYLTTRQMIRKTGPAQDPQGRLMQGIMLYGFPASLLISGFIFPIGVILYWFVQNVFALGQQAWILRKYPPVPTAEPASKPQQAGPAPKPQQAGPAPKPRQAGAAPKPRQVGTAPKVGAKPVRRAGNSRAGA